MHVFHLIDALAIGGAERMLVELANRTRLDGHRVSVCVSRSDVTLGSSLDASIPLIVLGRRSRFDLAPLWKLTKWLRANHVDVVHCHGRSSFSLVIALRALGAVHQPVLLHDHFGVELDASVPRWFRVASKSLGAYVGVYANHALWAQRAGVPPERINVIGNAIDVDSLEHQRLVGPPLPPWSGRTLINIGGIRREKAVDVLIDAMKHVSTDVRLAIVGGDADADYAARCRAQVARAALGDRISFLGVRRDAIALARTVDLAVHASRSESGPLVLAEYAALGIPFVATRVGGVARRLQELGVGAYVSPDDPSALAAEITTALSNHSDVGRGRAVAREEFDITIAMTRWYGLYRQIAEA